MSNLLQENGDDLLQETGDFILLDERIGRSIEINGTDYSGQIRLNSFLFTECANRGEVGTGFFEMDDATAALDVPALKPITVMESSASSPYLFTGYTHDRGTERGPNKAAGQRQWRVEAIDLNTLADDYILTEAEGANRGAETDYVRVAWLLTTRFNDVANVGVGIVPNTNTVNMDAMDYRGRTAREVLNECSEMAGKNWFIYLYTGTQPLLFYDVTSGTNLTSTSKISDVAADVDGSTTWAAIGPPTVRKSPDAIYSTVRVVYNGGTVSVTNATTASTYRTREISVMDMSIDTSAKATAKANAFLAASASEKITVNDISVALPAANVNDFRAGQRFQLKLSRHGVNSFTYYRILRREIRALNDITYLVTLTLADQVLPTIYTNQRGGDVYGIWEKKSNATDDGATVVVDAGGISVIDGAITVVNPGGTTIIDGTSDIFKIAAEGTHSVTIAADSFDQTDTTITALGSSYTVSPAAMMLHATSNAAGTANWPGPLTSGASLLWVASVNGGSPNDSRWQFSDYIYGTTRITAGQVVVKVAGWNPTGGSITRYQKYFVLIETGF